MKKLAAVARTCNPSAWRQGQVGPQPAWHNRWALASTKQDGQPLGTGSARTFMCTHTHTIMQMCPPVHSHRTALTHRLTQSPRKWDKFRNELCIVPTSWRTHVFVFRDCWSSLVLCGPLEVTMVALLFEVIFGVLSWTLRRLCWKLFFLLY